MPKPIVYRRPARTRGSRGRRLPERERPAEEYTAEEEAALDELIDRRFSAIANNLRRRGLFNSVMTKLDPTHVPVIEGADWTPDCDDWQPYSPGHGDPDPADPRYNFRVPREGESPGAFSGGEPISPSPENAPGVAPGGTML